VATVDLNSLGAKMELARKLADTVSRVHDPLMKGEVSNKISARIGVPVVEFERLFSKPSRQRVGEDESRRFEPAPAPRHDVAMLCLLALRDTSTREFLRQQSWREALAQTPGTELLVRILENELRPDDPASLNA